MTTLKWLFRHFVRIWIEAATARGSLWHRQRQLEEKSFSRFEYFVELCFSATILGRGRPPRAESAMRDAIGGNLCFRKLFPSFVSFPSVSFLMDINWYKIFSGKLWCKADANASLRPPICTGDSDWVTAANRLNGPTAAYGRNFSVDFWVSHLLALTVFWLGKKFRGWDLMLPSNLAESIKNFSAKVTADVMPCAWVYNLSKR